MTAVQVDPDRLYWDDHVRDGLEARAQRDGAQWRLGDLASSIETTYGESDLEKYAKEIGVEYGTLREYRRVAVAYGNANRLANLSWTHHFVVAALPDRNHYLRLATEEGWSVARLREESTPQPPVTPDVGAEAPRPRSADAARVIRDVQRDIERGDAAAEGAAFMREFSERNPLPADYDEDADKRRIERVFRLFNAVENLTSLPDPRELIAEIPEYQSYRLNGLTAAIDWLDRFATAWGNRK